MFQGEEPCWVNYKSEKKSSTIKSVPEQHLVNIGLLADAKYAVKENILDNKCLNDQNGIKDIAEIACFLGKRLTTQV